MSFEWIDSVRMLAVLLFSFLLLFVWMPALALNIHPEDRDLFSPLFIRLMRACLFLICLVHLLVFLKLYETLSIVTLVVVAMVVYYRSKVPKRDLPLYKWVLALVFDLSESRRQLNEMLRRMLHSASARSKQAALYLPRLLVRRPVAFISFGLVFGFAAYVRFHYSMTNQTFAFYDPYVDLKWVKELGQLEMYVDGIYPMGFEAILSALNRFFMLDLYIIIRFMGPIAGILIVFSIYYAVRKLGGDGMIGFASVFAYTVWSVLQPPTVVERQIATLPMEFASIFFLPGIVFLILYLEHDEQRHVRYAAEALMLVTLIHPYTAVCLALAYMAVAAVHARKLLNGRRFLRILTYMAVAGFLGIMPLVIGLLSGREFHSRSMNYISRNVGAHATGSKLLDPFEADPYWTGLAALAAIFLLVMLFLLLIRKPGSVYPPLFIRISPVASVVLVYYVIDRANVKGLFSFMPRDRFGEYYAIIVAVAIGFVIHVLASWIRREAARRAMISLCCLGLVVTVFASGDIVSPPKGKQIQYNEAVQAVERIKKQFPRFDWTIVSPIEEYPMAMGYGYHMNLWEFVQHAVEDKKNEFRFSTDHVFFFVEKKPIDSSDFVSESDARQPFPIFQSGDLTDFYYRNPEHRHILQAKLLAWAAAPNDSGPKLSLWFDSPHFAVYYMRQDKTSPISLVRLDHDSKGR